ncbi:MAG: hypothetical protein ACLPN5_01905 [Roseiarcus sp.]
MSADITPIPSEAPPGRLSFDNSRIALAWGGLAVLGLALFVGDSNDLVGIAGGLLALFALQAAVSFDLGVRLTDHRVTLPRALAMRAPLIAIGRTSFPLPSLREITSHGRLLGHEWVRITAEQGQFVAIFESRERRLAFFEEVRRRQPQVKIYRG